MNSGESLFVPMRESNQDFSILPLLRHLVQSLIRFDPPLTFARTVTRLGRNSRTDLLFAWLTL